MSPRDELDQNMLAEARPEPEQPADSSEEVIEAPALPSGATVDSGRAAPAIPMQPSGTVERQLFSVTDVLPDKPDAADRMISRVFTKRRDYAVYTAIAGPDEEVWVQFSDDYAEATEQLSRLATLTGMRQKLDYLTRGLIKTRCYHLGQIAWALTLGIEGRVKEAEEVLAGSILTATEERARIGRRLYLANALLFAAVAAVVLGALAAVFGDASRGADLLGGAAAGALGALLSIAMAIRSRTVAPDHDVVSNRWDAILRLTMGILSAGALVLLLTSHLIGAVTIGGTEIGGEALANNWRAILVIGFAAGFLERLVPDLLESKVPERPTASELANTASPG